MEVVNYKNFKLSELKLVNNEILYLNNEIYLDTPNLKIFDIIDIDNKTYLQLKISKKLNSIYFINSILAIETFIKQNISNNSFVINSQILKDISENIYLKVKISRTLNNIFDKKQNIIPLSSLEKGKNIKCIIKITNLYKDDKSLKVGYSLELYQLMILN